ncbi:hypothetical protein AZE42_04052 [Rhizopogon vesiculosus]|uniref:EamA domain-containing protein n=1 Tax=Rhizopogon vesiculosus TaxID=180088 RepID=A0A1J8QYD0_9AGAM|nr:hypothetical protein AZE42_04052 [Rhizopogon vesiculosus]
MTSTQCPLVRDIEHNYGSIAPISGICRDDESKPNDSSRSIVPDIIANNAGILFIITSQFFFAAMGISVKLLNSLEPPVHALQVIVVRMGITFICCVIYMVITRVPDPIVGPRGVRTLLVIRGITGFFGLCGLYWSLQYLSVADATVLTDLTPLTTAVAGCLILKESYSMKQTVAAVCSLIGVVLIARPPFLFGSPGVNPQANHVVPEATPEQRLLAVGACMISVLGSTGAYTSIRAIGKRAHSMHIMTFFSLWSTIIAALGMIVFKIPVVYPNTWTWALVLFMVGINGFVAQALLTLGLQREALSLCVIGVYVQVLFAVVLERLFFGVTPSLLSVLGAAIIISAAIYVVLSKQKQQDD